MISKKNKFKGDRKVTIENGHVIKWHQTTEALLQEVEALETLCILNGRELEDSWIIHIPEVLKVDKAANHLFMERLSGKTLDLAIDENRNLIPWRNIGAALAIYHNSNINEGNMVYCLGDYNRSNILIDFSGKIIGIIDPGIRHGRQALWYRDVLVFERALWFAQIKHQCLLQKELMKFRKGYFSEFSIDSLLTSDLQQELLQQWNYIKQGANKRPGFKKALYLTFGLIWMLKQSIDLKFKSLSNGRG